MIARAVVEGGKARGTDQLGGFAQLLNDFARFLVREDRSPDTVRSYRWALADFTGFLEANGATSIEALRPPAGRALTERWQDSIQRLKPASRSLAAVAVRQFFRWAADHDLMDPRAERWLAQVKVRKGKPKPLKSAEVALLVEYFGRDPANILAVFWREQRQLHPSRKPPPRPPYWLQWLRDRASFFYLVGTGARASEAIQVPRRGYERCTVIQKGRTEKLLVCPDAIWPILEDYLEERTDDYRGLFAAHPPRRPAGPISVSGLRSAWLKVEQELGVRHFTTHHLRHTFATILRQRGVPLSDIAELMGHHDMNTVQVYAEFSEVDRAKGVESVASAMREAGLKPSAVKRRKQGRPKLLRVLGDGDSTT